MAKQSTERSVRAPRTGRGRTASTVASPVLATYVAYYRVSTKAQGESGLGLEAQRSAVAGYVKGSDRRAVILAEFTEVESGKNNQRVQLAAAIDRAKKESAVLVIAKLDRLSRNASFIFTLRDSGVNFQCVDMPDANTLTIGIFATLAQHERELISSRTKSALQAKRAQGAKLGKPENLTSEGQKKGGETTRRNALANENNRRAASMITILRQAGWNLTQITAELNRAGFRTAKGGQFQATQVMRLANQKAHR